MSTDLRDLRRRAEADPEAAATLLVEALAEVRTADDRPLAVRRREPLARHLPLRAGGPADLWVEVTDEQALSAVLSAARSCGVSWRICWPFEEVLYKDGGQRGLVLRPGGTYEEVRLQAADDHGPARLILGAAAPWAAAYSARARAHHLADEASLARGPLAEIGTWPGCPGGLLAHGDLAGLEGIVSALTWRKGRRVERVEVPAAGVPAPLPGTAVLRSVEVPLAWPEGARRLRQRHRPPPTGTLFADDGPTRAGAQLRLCNLLGTRLRDWQLSPDRPGVAVNLGTGGARDLALLAKGLREHINRHRGALLDVRIQTLGVDGARR